MRAGEHDRVGATRANRHEARRDLGGDRRIRDRLSRHRGLCEGGEARVDPTRVTPQSAAKLSISARVYSRCTVPGVASTDTNFERDSAAAGLIAGTVPTKGRSGSALRKSASTSVEAVLQATTHRSGRMSSTRLRSTATTRGASSAADQSP